MDKDKLAILTAIGRGHLVYRPKLRAAEAPDYVTSVGLVKVDRQTVRQLCRDGLLVNCPGMPGALQLSEKGQKEAGHVDAILS